MQPGPSQKFQYKSYTFVVFFLGVTVDNNIIQVSGAEWIEVGSQRIVDVSLERSWGIG